jgi:hypothetical protein
MRAANRKLSVSLLLTLASLIVSCGDKGGGSSSDADSTANGNSTTQNGSTADGNTGGGNTGGGSTTGTPANNPAPEVKQTSAKFALVPPSMAAQTTLGRSTSAIVNLTVMPGLTGSINLAIDRSALDSTLNAGGDISLNISPSKITLDGVKTAYSIIVNVSATAHAPSFKSTLDNSGDQGHVRVKASLEGGTEASEAIVPLSVLAIFEVRLLNANHDWDPPNSAFPISIRAHPEGTTLRFVNYDTTLEHVIHGNDLIPHQGSAVPTQPQTLTKAPAVGQPGGKYEIVVTEAQIAAKTVKTGSFYCHAHANLDVVNGQTAIKVFQFDK